MRSRVFLANEPLAFDHATGVMKRNINLEPAKRYGDLVILLPGRPSTDADEILPALEQGLSSASAQDYLLLAGSPAFMIWAAVIAAKKCPNIRMLNWDKQTKAYEVLPLT